MGEVASLSHADTLIDLLRKEWNRLQGQPGDMLYQGWHERLPEVITVCEGLGWNKTALRIFKAYLELGMEFVATFSREESSRVGQNHELVSTWFESILFSLVADHLPAMRVDALGCPPFEWRASLIDKMVTLLFPALRGHYTNRELRERLNRLAARRYNNDEGRRQWITTHAATLKIVSSF